MECLLPAALHSRPGFFVGGAVDVLRLALQV